MSQVPRRHLPTEDLKSFGVDPERGFLPGGDPIARLPAAYSPWEEMAESMPKLLAACSLRRYLDRMPVLDVSRLAGEDQWQRAMLLLSYFGHGYVWGADKPSNRIPASVAVPWHQVASRLGRLPVLSYSSYALYNWRRLDPSGPVALGNIVLLQDFLGGLDEEWFVLVHVDIEAKAGPALAGIFDGQRAVYSDEAAWLEKELGTVAAALELMYSSLLRMPERCDPYVYYNRVRPYIHGWKDNPGLPEGVIYEGVEAYDSRPQKLRGETGAQSAIVPSLDAALGITHEDDPLRPYLMEMRHYMPPGHREFIEAMEEGPSIREYVLANRWRHPPLRHRYNECLERLAQFRSKHLEYAALYVQQQSQRERYNPTEVGTGGTPFMAYLKKHRDETLQHIIG